MSGQYVPQPVFLPFIGDKNDPSRTLHCLRLYERERCMRAPTRIIERVSLRNTMEFDFRSYWIPNSSCIWRLQWKWKGPKAFKCQVKNSLVRYSGAIIGNPHPTLCLAPRFLIRYWSVLLESCRRCSTFLYCVNLER